MFKFYIPRYTTVIFVIIDKGVYFIFGVFFNANLNALVFILFEFNITPSQSSIIDLYLLRFIFIKLFMK